jgi:hypothetical protein
VRQGVICPLIEIPADRVSGQCGIDLLRPPVYHDLTSIHSISCIIYSPKNLRNIGMLRNIGHGKSLPPLSLRSNRIAI